MKLSLAEHGAEHRPGALKAQLPVLIDTLSALPQERAGSRIADVGRLRPLMQPDGPIGGLAAMTLGPRSRAVRAILFDKTQAINWSLGWHQDRTICVRQRVSVEGFERWTVKQGLHHVEPPFSIIEQMVTIRVHLDEVPADNAPLLIAPASHTGGRIAEQAIPQIVERCGIAACLAHAGDAWLHAAPLLHASAPATTTIGRRRVLQIDFSSAALPAGLEWLGI